jgi:hypothetical protein
LAWVFGFGGLTRVLRARGCGDGKRNHRRYGQLVTRCSAATNGTSPVHGLKL